MTGFIDGGTITEKIQNGSPMPDLFAGTSQERWNEDHLKLVRAQYEQLAALLEKNPPFIGEKWSTDVAKFWLEEEKRKDEKWLADFFEDLNKTRNGGAHGSDEEFLLYCETENINEEFFTN